MTDQTPVVTFDFHDTIARCDRWFALEIRELVPAFLVWHAERHGTAPPNPAALERGRLAYHALRAEVRDTGIERDAVAALVAILPGLGRDVPEAEIRLGVDVLMAETFDDEVVPLPGVIETVRYLAGQGTRLGIVSSAVYTPFLHWTLDRFGLAGDFAMVLTSADAGFYKSHPGIYWQAAQRLDRSPGRIVHVGDSFGFDVEAGRRAGFRAVWVLGERPTPDERAADLTLPDLVGAGPSILGLARSAANDPVDVHGR